MNYKLAINLLAYAGIGIVTSANDMGFTSIGFWLITGLCMVIGHTTK